MLLVATVTVSGFVSFNSTNITSYVQDVVYQTDRSLSDYSDVHLKVRMRYFGPAYGPPSMNYFTSENLMVQLREAYLVLRPASSGFAEFYLGKKRNSFGFADAFSSQDVVDPFEVVVPTDLNERAPSVVSQISLYPCMLYSAIAEKNFPFDSEVDFLVRAFNRPSFMGFFADAVPFTSMKYPQWNITNAFYMARLRLAYYVFDFDVAYFRGINSFPVLESVKIVNGVPVAIKAEYPWLSGITGGLSWSLFGTNFYVEGVYDLFDRDTIPVDIQQTVPSPPFVVRSSDNLTLEDALKISAGVDFGFKGFEFVFNGGYGLPWEYSIKSENSTFNSFETHLSYYALGRITRKFLSNKIELGVSGLAFLAENATDNIADNLNYMLMFCAGYMPGSSTTFKVITSLSGGEEPFVRLSELYRVMLYFETKF